jgi:exosortase D (VPLPA-CTERM-specific)
LVTLGFLVAYIYNAALWKRALVFLSTIPITVLMNSFRIGVIGVTVDRWGQKMAEGFLHDFEGWVIFMACFGVLFVEMWLLMRLTGDRRDLREVFGLEAPVKVEGPSMCLSGPIPKPLVGSTIGLLLAVSAGYLLPERQELTPPRTAFSEFPVQFADWQGRPEPMEQVYIDALKFTDYALINFKNSGGDVINLYSAYYESQRKGESVHSPRSCLPGGGWEIQSLTQVDVPNATVDGVPLRVNRALISYGDQKQLVYYWFQQRGRVMTNEFLVKWYMLIDAIFMHRTDGALVRVIAPLTPGGDVSRLDGALNEFTADIAPMLSRYIPK